MKKILFLQLIIVFSQYNQAQENRVEIWNRDKSSSASCIEKKFPICQVVVNGKIIDVSQVTYSNIGKLGTLNIIDYEKVITEPVEWLESNMKLQLVVFRTQAWRDGQKYTVSEPVLVKNGKYHAR